MKKILIEQVIALLSRPSAAWAPMDEHESMCDFLREQDISILRLNPEASQGMIPRIAKS